MRFCLIRCLAVLTVLGTAAAQTTRDCAVDLAATTSSSSPYITLTWTLRQASSIASQVVYRRLKGEQTWVSQATLSVSDTSWPDPTAEPGKEYEYWMQRTYSGLSPNMAVGYITAGYDLPLVEDRGKLLLVVDATMETPLGPEIAQLQRDLTADGWTVQTISAARRDSLTDNTAVADTKSLIKAAYDADPTKVNQVYILGHVPVPYSGNHLPDGHSGHYGAWSADGFYGEMNGTWTDSSVNNTYSTETRINNVPGDGKLDQSALPSALELMVGRVDLRNMQRAPASNVTETALLRRYLRKAHDFKTKQGAYANLERRVLIRDGFGNTYSEAFMRTGWAWGFTGVGRPPEVIFDEAPSGDWWTLAATNSYLMANGNGGGSYETCGTVGATADFGRRPFRAAFVSLFGSYFGDWDVTNNFMKAPLAGNATGDGLGLTCFWAGRPVFFMHHMATGETVGYSIRTSMNSQYSSISSPVYQPANSGYQGTHMGLMGDPSLRMHVVEPPRHLAATSSNGAVQLSWAASTEPYLLGYHIYRSASPGGPFTRLTPTPSATPSHTDGTGSPGSTYTYMVRVLKMEHSPGGTYENLSLGEMATITVEPGTNGIPLNPTGLTAVHQSSTSALLTWQDNASDETSYRVERKDGADGTFVTVATLGAGTVSHLDAGPFTNNEVYYFRVVAVNSAGDSLPSNEASFDASAGFFEFPATLTKTSKTIGTATFPVRRFGGVNGPVSVNYATSNSSAIAGTHYTSQSGTLNWADGEGGEQLISVPIANIATPTYARQFRLTLSSASAGTGIGTYSAMSVLIEDPTATLSAPWTQATLGSLTDSSASVEAEGGISSTTVGGSGLATAATSEVGQFVYQSRSGDGVLTAYVPAASPAQSGARYAVMIRESTSGGSLMAGVSTSTSSSDGTKMFYRATASATATFTGAVTAQTVPRWLRVTRAGNTFTAESSADGTTWHTHGSTTVAMASTALWGLFHHSDDRSTSTYSGNYQSVSFQNVTFSAISGPGAPGTLTFTQPSSSRVTLSWSAGTNAAGYRVERRAENGTFSQIVDLTGLTFNDDQVAPDTAYEYRVYAFNSSGNSPLSNTIRVTTSPSDVQVLLDSGLGATGDATIRGDSASGNFGSDTLLRVAGNSSSGSSTAAAKTYLQFDLSSLPASATLKTAMLRLAVATVKDLDLTGFTYSATLRFLPDAHDGWNESSINWTNAPLNNTGTNGFLTGTTAVSTLSVTSSTLPSPGSILGLDASAATINSSKGSNNLVSYVMNSTTPVACLEFASREHPTLPPPTLEVTYASPLPTRPSFLDVQPGAGSSIDLSWVDNSSAETGFEIERREAGGAFASLTSVAANTVSFNDSTSINGITYEYRVRAQGANGDSAWSLIAAATAGGSTGPLPGVPAGFEGWMLLASAAPSDDTSAHADLDQDGLSNLAEYALGTRVDAPGNGAPLPGTAQIDGQTFLTLTFQRKINATDVIVAVETSDSPAGPWTTLDPLQPENQVSVRSNDPTVGLQTITVRDRVALGDGARRFMRLSVTKR